MQAKRFLPSNSQPSQVFQTFCSFKGSKKVIFLDTSLGSKNPSKNRSRHRGPPQFKNMCGHECSQGVENKCLRLQNHGRAAAWKTSVAHVQKPAPIHGEHLSPALWPHTRIFPGKTKLVLQPRSSTQTYNQEPNNIQQTYTKPTFSRSPKPTNDKRPTNQKEWLSARYTWNALAQVWSAPFEEAPGLQC